MDQIEARGKTKEEALLNAAMELKTTTENLEYEIIDKGSAGFLGFIGRKDVVLRVWRKEGTTSVEEEFDALDMTLTRPSRKDRQEKQSKPAQDRQSKPAQDKQSKAAQDKQSKPAQEKSDRKQKPKNKDNKENRENRDNSKNGAKARNQEQRASGPAKRDVSKEEKPSQEKEPIKIGRASCRERV